MSKGYKHNQRYVTNMDRGTQTRLLREATIAKTKGIDKKRHHSNLGEIKSFLICETPLVFDKAECVATHCPNAVVGGTRYAEWVTPAKVDISKVSANIEQYNIFMRGAFVCQVTKRGVEKSFPFRGYVVKGVNKNGMFILGSGHVMFSLYYKMDREDRRPFARCLEMIVFERARSLMTFDERWGMDWEDDGNYNPFEEYENKFAEGELDPSDEETWRLQEKIDEDRNRVAMGLPPIHNLEEI